MLALTFGLVSLVAGTALAVNKMCPDYRRGTAGDDGAVLSSHAYDPLFCGTRSP